MTFTSSIYTSAFWSRPSSSALLKSAMTSIPRRSRRVLFLIMRTLSRPGFATRAKLNTAGVVLYESQESLASSQSAQQPAPDTHRLLQPSTPFKMEGHLQSLRVVRKFCSQQTRNEADTGSTIEPRIHLHRLFAMLSTDKNGSTEMRPT